MADEDSCIEETRSILDPDDLIVYDENSNDNECALFVNDENIISTIAQITEGDSHQTESSDEILAEFERHRLEIQQVYNEFGVLEPSYYCQKCDISFPTLEEYIGCHPQNAVIECPLNAVDATNIRDDNEVNAADNLHFANIRNEDQAANQTNQNIQENNPCGNDPNRNNENTNAISFNNIVMGSDLLNENLNGYQLNDDVIIKVKERMMHNADCFYCYDCQRLFMDCHSAVNHDCLSNQQHLNDDANINVIHMCSYCHVDFETNDELLAHRLQCEQEVAKDSNFITVDRKLLHERFANASSLEEQHFQETDDLENTMTSARTATCNICQTSFSNKKNLKLHLRIHSQRADKTILDALPAGAEDDYKGFYKFYCEICNKSFDENLLEIHKSMHQNVLEYNCGTCNRAFDTLANYQIHLKMHLETLAHRKANQQSRIIDSVSNGKHKYPCQHCGKEFPRPYEKVKHERIHTGEKPYACEVCGKTFRVSYSLTLHLRTHTNIRPYVCSTCNKRFKSQSVYIHHLNTHKTERRFKCDQCPKSFRTTVQLCGHKNCHQKPFSCPVCLRPFASLYAVKIHMKTHDGNSKTKPTHQCSICEVNFKRAKALRIHLRHTHKVPVKPTKSKTASHETASHEAECAIEANQVETLLVEQTANDLIYLDEIDVGAHTLTETMPMELY